MPLSASQPPPAQTLADIPSPRASSWSRITLRRIVTSNHYLPQVDGFRFLALFIVVLSHVYRQFGVVPAGPVGATIYRAFLHGPRGVCLFFTISGFILALPFARHSLQSGAPVDLRRYYLRRLTRLEPPYLLMLLLRAPWLALSGVGVAVLPHLLASVLYVHSLVYPGVPITINPIVWSLEVEVQFYLLAPLLMIVFLIPAKLVRRLLLVAAIIAGGIPASLFFHGGSLVWLGYYLHYFLAGLLLADLYLTQDRIPVPAWLWDILAVLAVVWILYSRAFWYPAIVPFVTVVLYLAGFHGYCTRAFFAFRPVSLIGGMCYSIYLTHTAVLSALSPLAHRLERTALPPGLVYGLVFAGATAILLAFGTAYYLFIERPCMDPAWPQKLAARFKRS